jgi:hypothetical protein
VFTSEFIEADDVFACKAEVNKGEKLFTVESLAWFLD